MEAAVYLSACIYSEKTDCIFSEMPCAITSYAVVAKYVAVGAQVELQVGMRFVIRCRDRCVHTHFGTDVPTLIGCYGRKPGHPHLGPDLCTSVVGTIFYRQLGAYAVIGEVSHSETSE